MLVCVSLCVTCMWVFQRSEEGVGPPRAGDTGGCEPLMGMPGIKLWSSARTASVLTIEFSLQPDHPHLFLKQCFSVAQAILELCGRG